MLWQLPDSPYLLDALDAVRDRDLSLRKLLPPHDAAELVALRPLDPGRAQLEVAPAGRLLARARRSLADGAGERNGDESPLTGRVVHVRALEVAARPPAL